MNILAQLLMMLAGAFEHIVGDPVHTQSAAALKTTLEAAAHAVENGVEEGIATLHSAVAQVASVGRAVTAEEWAKLHAAATALNTAAIAPSVQVEPAPEPAKTAS